MSLPKVSHPTFKVVIPSTKKTVSFRPYTVREEKLLLLLNNVKDIQEAVDVVKEIITNCCVDKIDINSLATFDIEYIFVKLRSKSVGEELELFYNFEENKKVPFKVDLDKVEVYVDPKHKKKFNIYNDIGVSMKYPNFELMVKYEDIIVKGEEQSSQEFLFDLFVDCIDSVYDNDKVYEEFTRDELSNFILSLPVSSVEYIKNFFETIPVLKHEITIKLPDKTEKKIELKGLKDFFLF